jgi:hypothetical protein
MKKMKRIALISAFLAAVAFLGAVSVTVGDGSEQNRKPFDFFYRFSLFETLYYPSELNTAGYIQALTFYNNFPNAAGSSGRIQIWLGTTELDDLSSGWIPSTQLTSVINQSILFPAGQNEITLNLSTPFLYTGGNLVLLARTPGNTIWQSGPLNFYCQTVGTTRARDFFSNTVNADHAAPPLTGTGLTLSGQFPKTTFHFSDLPPVVDLGLTSLTGPDQLTQNIPCSHTVSVSNFGTAAMDSYTVSLHGWNDQLLTSVSGPALSPGATADLVLNWTPQGFEGYTSLYARVSAAGDANQFNDTSSLLPVCYLPLGGGTVTNFGTLTGFVYNGQQQPIPNALITLQPGNLIINTETDGSYKFSWLEAGTYQMSVSASGYLDYAQSVTILAAQGIGLDIFLHSSTALILTGRVVSSAGSSQGVEHATVELVGSTVTAVSSDYFGYFTIYDVAPNQSFELRVSHPSYLSYYGSVATGNQNIDLGDLPLVWDYSTPLDNPDLISAPASLSCYPNPFSRSVNIAYRLKESGFASLDIYNVKGQKIRTLFSGTAKAGGYSAVWDGSDSGGRQAANGVYYYRLSAGSRVLTRSLVLIN